MPDMVCGPETCRRAGLSLLAYPPSSRRRGYSTCLSATCLSARSPPVQLAGLIPAALRDRGLSRARDLARKGGVDSDALNLTAPAALRPFVVAAVAASSDAGGAGRPVLAVTATSREADDLADALGCLISADRAPGYPSWETLPHERLSPRSDTVGRRLAVLRRLAHPADQPLQVVVAPVRSLLQPQLKGLGDLEPVELTAGGGAELEGVSRR